MAESTVKHRMASAREIGKIADARFIPLISDSMFDLAGGCRIRDHQARAACRNALRPM